MNDTQTINYIDVMVDLETTGTGPDAAIAAIGAVVFDRNNCILRDSYYDSIDISSAVANGGVIDPDTVKWWMRQSPEAQKAAFKGSSSIEGALHGFSIWINKQSCIANTAIRSELRVWGNGADFDMVVLGQSYKRAGIPIPWKFWNVRCFRTLKGEHAPIQMERSGTHHNALDDAITQAKHVLKIDREKACAGHPAPAALPTMPIPGELVTIEADHDLRRLGFFMCIAIGLEVITTLMNLSRHIF